MRYEFEDENGETRRQRNAKFEQPSPDIVWPHEVTHVWEWFWALSRRRRNEPLTYQGIAAWSAVTGTQVLPEEVQMLISMDDAYLKEVAVELDNLRQRQAERAAQQQGALRGRHR